MRIGSPISKRLSALLVVCASEGNVLIPCTRRNRSLDSFCDDVIAFREKGFCWSINIYHFSKICSIFFSPCDFFSDFHLFRTPVFSESSNTNNNNSTFQGALCVLVASSSSVASSTDTRESTLWYPLLQEALTLTESNTKESLFQFPGFEQDAIKLYSCSRTGGQQPGVGHIGSTPVQHWSCQGHYNCHL